MISVIIPIYNVKQYIERGMKYILAQDCCDFEVILVDDGSTDGSAEICEEWSQRDTRVRVFHKRNGGAGSARNLGIENAAGEYIYFYDIDDEIESNLLSVCEKKMADSSSEMMVFGYTSHDVVNNYTVTVDFPSISIENNSNLRNVFVDEFILKTNGFPWNKIYRKSFLKNYQLRFEDQRILQDIVFNLKCYRYVNRMIISNEVLYHYFVYNSGNTRSNFIPDRFNIYKTQFQRYELLKKEWNIEDVRFDDFLDRQLFLNMNILLRYNTLHTHCYWSRKEKQKEYHKVLDDKDFSNAIIRCQEKGISFEEKLFLWAYRTYCIELVGILDKLFDLLRILKRRVVKTIRQK